MPRPIQPILHFYGPLLIPIPETSSGDTWIQSLLTNFLSFNPAQHESNHHKQHPLITTSKIAHLSSSCDYEFHQYQDPALNILRKIMRKSFHPWGLARKSRTHFLQPNCALPWLTSETKDKILTHPACPILELYQEHEDKISADPKQNSLPQATTTQTLTTKALYNNNNNKNNTKQNGVQLVFHKGPFWVLYYSFCTLMIWT